MVLLIIHIVIALTSIVSSTYAFIAPTRTKINVTYGLTSLTVASGTYLVASTHSPLLASCITGLLYIGVVLSGIFAAQRKLVRQEIRIKRQ